MRLAEFTGLTAAEAAERIADGRANDFVAASSRSVWSIVRANAFTLFNGIIAGCFLVLLVIGRWQDALFGVSAVANTIIGSVQEFRAKRSLDRLALVNADDARVLRDSTEQAVPVTQVVLDELLVLRAGAQVPADAVVVYADALQLDESMLTGESDPVDKEVDDEVLSGSVVVGGMGLARVVRVGAESFANRFADEARRFSLVSSELRSSLNRVLRWVAWIIGPVTLLVLNSQMLTVGGWPHALSSGQWVLAVVASIASVVAMIPLGLVLMTSIAFAVGAVKLARQSVLVQELAAVEGLARVDIICLDKTGTLTEGEIVFDGAHPLPAPEAATGAAPTAGWESVLAWYGVQPDANATARSLAAIFQQVPAVEPSGSVAFTSATKWSSVSFAQGPAGTWVLGAPEFVLGVQARPAGAGLQERIAELASSGRRTLVLAHSPSGAEGFSSEDGALPPGLEPVVLLTFAERVRPDAAETLRYFAREGVQVRVISGDNPSTVAAIAREVGLPAATGFDARQLPADEQELAAVLEENLVFGRVTPEQKKRIVLALQAAGHTVAMTGDGVNDALAIKEADLGIAMNSGSPATKAVSRLVLLDGRFSHLPSVVAEGRQVIANIEQVSMLFLTKTVYATALALIFGVTMLQFPFLPRQLSVTDGLTIGLPAFFLALLPNRRRYEPGFLRRSLSFAVPAGIVIALTLALYSRAAVNLGESTEELRTGSTLILTIVGLWVLLVLTRPLTVAKTLIITLMAVGLILVYAVPLASDFLQLRDPGLLTAALVLAASAIAIGFIEAVRLAHLRSLRPRTGRSSAQPARSTARRSLPR